MTLREFDFIDESLNLLNELTPTLNMLSEELEDYFKVILDTSKQEYLNINSRVKSEASLREKIIRNRYVKKYQKPKNLMHNLSDLIGIRLECRFIEDEAKLCKLLKKYFDKTDDKIYYYNVNNENIKIRLDKKQPQKQKNGFEIYRIDGIFEYGDKQFNFEIQIKSLVNIFWSEIEHKIIYKNTTYLIADKFLSEIMHSIKNNLTMMDKQLLSVYNNFQKQSTQNKSEKQKNVEKFLSKIVYDTFADKMVKDIGFVVDFKMPCETIINYSFSKTNLIDESYGDLAIKALTKINQIGKKDIDFNSKIEFEKEPEYKDDVCKKIGEHIRRRINEEFTWNLFFRILFEVEPLDNVGDFEKFILFTKENLLSLENISKIENKFDENSTIILNDIYRELSELFIELDTIEFIYVENFYKIDNLIGKEIDNICKNINDYKEYKVNSAKYMKNIKECILNIF